MDHDLVNDKQPTTRTAPPWVFFTLILGFAVYYAQDVWGGRFETVAYGLLCIAILGVLGLLLVVSAIEEKRRAEPYTEGTAERAEGVPTSLWPFVLLLILIAYAWIQATTGFTIATLLAFASLTWFFGERRWGYVLVTAISMTIVTYVTFVQLLSIPVPEGLLFNWR